MEVREITFKSAMLSQTCQDLVLDAFREISVVRIPAQIFKWQHCDASCYGLLNKFAFPSDDTQRHCQGKQHGCHERNTWIASHPLSSASKNSTAPGANRLVPQPMLKVISKRCGGLVARFRIGLQTASDDCLQIAVERWQRVNANAAPESQQLDE